jgi:hypothetical protein
MTKQNVVLLVGIAFLMLSANANAQKCKQVVNYQSKKVDFKGLNVNGLGYGGGNSDGFTSTSTNLREATEEVQKLDLLQFNMCNQMKSCKSDAIREKLAYQQNNIMLKMLKVGDDKIEAAAEETAVIAKSPQAAPEPEPAAVSNANVDLEFPCQGDDYFSTDDIIRGTGEGWSMDAQMAKREARTAALEDLAAKIEITVKTLCEDYSATKKNGLDENLVKSLENKTQTIVNQTISGWKSICEKMRFNESKNRYTCYMAVEISIKQVMDGTYSKLREDAAIKNALPPQQIFEQKFNEIMSEVEQSNNVVLDY